MSENIDFTFPWETLISWYEKNGRHHLPWRDYSIAWNTWGISSEQLLYRVWLSEIFLQQTQVDRVIGYFQKVLERYPDIESLARSDYDEFFPYYQGMGYYSRARNILKTAKKIVDEDAGIFPRNIADLKKLPGIGEYTARAILAFGCGKPYLAWDTNLEKVFSRYYHGRKDQKLSLEEKEKIEKNFRDFIAKRSGVSDRIQTVRSINNALMDFSSGIDLKNPQNIDWENYPIQSGVFYSTQWSLEPQEIKITKTFPIPDARVVVILHQDHKLYFSEKWSESYSPFFLPPALHRDIRQYVQEQFRERYSVELSVRPIHRKWLSDEGIPHVMMNAQIQVWTYSQFQEFPKIEAKKVLHELGFV